MSVRVSVLIHVSVLCNYAIHSVGLLSMQHYQHGSARG